MGFFVGLAKWWPLCRHEQAVTPAGALTPTEKEGQHGAKPFFLKSIFEGV
jgi:hypothetical protein